MPRSLTFKYGESEFACELNKIDRKKLYGSVSVTTNDIDGNRCSLATLANDGKTLIPYGGTALGYVNKDNLWVERNELKPVSFSGEELPMLPSSFDIPIELTNEVTLEDFLNYSSRLVYWLGRNDDFDPTLATDLAAGKIFRFDFLYRSGISADPAFLLASEDGMIWMVVGKPSSIEFVGLDQAAVCFTDDQNDDDDAEEEFDFEML